MVNMIYSQDTFEQELARQEMTSRIDDGIYLGGLAVQSHSLSGKAKLRLAKIILVQ
jgi:hypothetical protein